MASFYLLFGILSVSFRFVSNRVVPSSIAVVKFRVVVVCICRNDVQQKMNKFEITKGGKLTDKCKRMSC